MASAAELAAEPPAPVKGKKRKLQSTDVKPPGKRKASAAVGLMYSLSTVLRMTEARYQTVLAAMSQSKD